MCFVWIWEQTAIISLYSINWLVFVTETECVYCAVRTGSLYIIQVMCFVWICEQTAIISLYSVNWLVLATFSKMAKSDYYLPHACPPARPHGTTRLPLDEFSWNLVLEYVEKFEVSLKFAKNSRHFSWRPVHIRLCRYLAESFWEWEMFHAKDVGKIQTHILCSISSHLRSRKSSLLWHNVEKYCRDWLATDGNMAHANCMLDT
jgi:hypothetical protein